MKELDTYGAPLLFLAASSQGEHCCFDVVFEHLESLLGKDGVTEQVMAMDIQKRGIMSYAARGRNESTFDRVKELVHQELKSYLSQEQMMLVDEWKMEFIRKRSTAKKHEASCMGTEDTSAQGGLGDQSNRNEAGTQINCAETKNSSLSAGTRQTTMEPGDHAKTKWNERLRNVWKKHFSYEDDSGRTLLHHASEFGSKKILEEVKRTGKELGVFDEMNKVDKNGRTPIMHVFRNMDRKSTEEDIQRKVDLLWNEPGTKEGLVQKREVLSPCAEEETYTTYCNTGLIHAARGGITTFKLALQKLGEEFSDAEHDLDKLGMRIKRKQAGSEECIDDAEPIADRFCKPFTWARAMLVAAAARGGQAKLLDHILRNIPVRMSVTDPSTITQGRCR